MKIKTCLLGAMSVLAINACGSDTYYVQVQSANLVSKGKELEDLQRALKAGAITQEEFDRLQPILLRRPN